MIYVRAVSTKETSSFYNIGYRNKKNTAFQPMVSMSNNYFFFLSPNSIFFLQWECGTSPLETDGFSPMAISWFLGALGQEKTWFLDEETISMIFVLFLH